MFITRRLSSKSRILPDTAIISLILYSISFAAYAQTMVTVDSSPDNGANPCTAASYGNPLQHTNTDQAFSNLASAGGNGEAVIVGHGNTGFISTCCGQKGQIYIAKGNRTAWWAHASKLRDTNYKRLTLHACCTGGGIYGAQLLHMMAGATGMPVRAPTGITFCLNGKAWLEPGAVWQESGGWIAPQPIEPPRVAMVSNNALVFLDSAKQRNTIDSSAILSAELDIFIPEFETELTTSTVKVRSMQPLSSVDFSNPIVISGDIQCHRSALLNVTFQTAGETTTRQFNVYGDRLIQDAEQQDVYYQTTLEFTERIERMRGDLR